MQQASDIPSLKEMERDGWQQKAAVYDAFAGQMTRVAARPLLEAVAARPGMRILDVCCGPGYGAGEAVSRGLTAIGIDIAPAMVEEARRRFPAALFKEGDAEALEFADASFDAAICAFGILHLPEPEKAISEVFRILRPSGRYAFTVWCGPEKADLISLALKAMTAHARMDVPLPPAPSMFAFSNPATSTAALERAGFQEVSSEQLPIRYVGRTAEDVFDWLEKSTVRTMALFRLQTAEVQERIREEIVGAARAYSIDDQVQIPCPAVLYAARKP
jgi:ubiquinone/menaquinone biosynthesis C-methylase UbiE